MERYIKLHLYNCKDLSNSTVFIDKDKIFEIDERFDMNRGKHYSHVKICIGYHSEELDVQEEAVKIMELCR